MALPMFDGLQVVMERLEGSVAGKRRLQDGIPLALCRNANPSFKVSFCPMVESRSSTGCDPISLSLIRNLLRDSLRYFVWGAANRNVYWLGLCVLASRLGSITKRMVC